jgi:hypothetical protein
MRMQCAVLALAALTSGAQADFFKCDLQVSTDNGATWGDNAVVPATGGAVKVRFVLSAQRAAGLVSIAGTQIRQIDLTNPDPADVLSDLTRPLAYSGQPNGFNFSIQGSAILHATNQTQVNQWPLSSSFGPSGVADNPWAAASFVYNVAASGFRTIIMSSTIGSNGMNTSAVFTTPGGSNATFPASQRIFDGATITVLPTPASAMLLGLAGLGASRRRR